MPKIAKELKDKLLEEGRWGDFVRYRQELRDQGETTADSHHLAIKEFFNNPPKKVSEYGSDNPKRKPENKASLSSPPFKAQEEGSESSPGPSSTSSPKKKKVKETTVKKYKGHLPALPTVSAADFNGKSASEVDAIRWVAANMEDPVPNPKECPSAAAWGHLAQCRSSIQAKADFWKLTFPKLLPTRADMEKKKVDLPGEGRIREVIDQLLAFKKEAEEGDEDAVQG